MKKIIVLFLTLSLMLVPIITLADEVNGFNPMYYDTDDDEEIIEEDEIEYEDDELFDDEQEYYPVTSFAPEDSSLDISNEKDVVEVEKDNNITLTSVEAIIVIAGILAFGIVIGSIIMFVLLKKTKDTKKKK